MDKISDIQAAINAGRELALKIEDINGTPVVLVPEDHRVVEFERLRDRPLRTEQTVKHSNANSFIEYYKKFWNTNTAVFLDTENNIFTAVFDYHHPSSPNWCFHKSSFQLKSTPEWQNWRGSNNKKMTQEEFGLFIEDNLVEIVNPPNGEMLEIALSLQAKTTVDFSKATRLDNGQVQFTYSENIDGKAGANGALKIPDLFTIGLRLYEGGDPYQMDARFRYRIKEGDLTLWYELVRPHKVVEANVRDTTALIEANTQPIFEAKVCTG